MNLNKKYDELARRCLKVSENMKEVSEALLRLGFTEEEVMHVESPRP